MVSKSDVRRLLVITYHFPPDGAIGGQRWAGLAKYLARLGWEVHIVTAAAGDPEPAPGVHRHFRARRRTLNDAYNAFVGRVSQDTRPETQPNAGNMDHPRSTSMRAIDAARRIVRDFIDFPDVARGWVLQAASEAQRLLREQAFDLVISSGPPHSAHFAAMLATIDRDVPFWIDMRDPWSAIYQRQAHRRAPNSWVVRGERFLMRALERLALLRAAKILANTREFAAALNVADPARDTVWFPNGVDMEQVPQRDSNQVEQGSMAYVGTVFAYRNLSSVCAAMRALLRDRPDAARRLKLNVAGSVEDLQVLREDIANGLNAVVTVHGVLPRAQALQLLGRSHLALVLAQDLPMAVPAKLYESVGAGVPTLVLAEPTSPSALEARRIGAMTVDGDDVDALRRVMEEMLAGRIPTSVAARTPISYEELALRMDRLLRGSTDTDA